MRVGAGCSSVGTVAPRSTRLIQNESLIGHRWIALSSRTRVHSCGVVLVCVAAACNHEKGTYRVSLLAGTNKWRAFVRRGIDVFPRSLSSGSPSGVEEAWKFLLNECARACANKMTSRREGAAAGRILKDLACVKNSQRDICASRSNT